MAYELRDYFETQDGSRPTTAGLDDALAKKHPIAAFSILRGGDVFERSSAKADIARGEAEAYVAAIELEGHGAEAAEIARVRQDAAQLLAGNPALVRRMAIAKALRIDIAPPGGAFTKLGLPRAMSSHVAGVFWDVPEWSKARIVVRRERLPDTPALVAHELGHAIFYLAFTDAERALIYDLLRPTFGSRASMDEAFAIYTEREVQSAFDAKDRAAPGIYGAVRRQWSNDQVFTRFVRKLYFPAKPLAGPGLAPI